MNKVWYPGIALLILIVCALVVSSVSAYTTDFPKSYMLWQGSSAVHEIMVSGSCGAQITVYSPYGAAFDLYAAHGPDSPGNCDQNEYIMRYCNRSAYASGLGGSATLYLDPDLWCVVVYARSGSGMAYVTVDTNCFPPGPNPPSPPVPIPEPCSPYRTVDRSGFLQSGQAAVYGYYVPADGRSKVEWSISSPGGGNTPIFIAGPSWENSSYDGSTFDLYVFKDCNPQNSYCHTRYYSYGPNAYVSVAPPQSGSTYYVMVYARDGSGTFNLRMNSYKCGNTPIFVTRTGSPISTASGASDDTGSGSEVSAPSAEIVISE